VIIEEIGYHLHMTIYTITANYLVNTSICIGPVEIVLDFEEALEHEKLRPIK
jgi:hypothetical protein